jgi:hypothetical protein
MFGSKGGTADAEEISRAEASAQDLSDSMVKVFGSKGMLAMDPTDKLLLALLVEVRGLRRELAAHLVATAES